MQINHVNEKGIHFICDINADMLYLILGIICNALLFMAFRSFAVFKINNLQAIVINYYVSVITGLVFTGKQRLFLETDYSGQWPLYALAIGALLVLGFYTATLNAQLVGVAITSVASKMSMVIPVLFSLFYLKIDTQQFTFLNYAGIVLALLAILLGSIKKDEGGKKATSTLVLILLPFAVFASGGCIDSLINYSNYTILKPHTAEAFPIFIFTASALVGTILLFFSKEKLRFRSVIGGIYLGIPNYFALAFGFKALSVFDNNGAVFFPMYNVGVIIASALLAIALFNEKFTKINLVGLGLSFVALFLLSYQEIIKYFSSLL